MHAVICRDAKYAAVHIWGPTDANAGLSQQALVCKDPAKALTPEVANTSCQEVAPGSGLQQSISPALLKECCKKCLTTRLLQRVEDSPV